MERLAVIFDMDGVLLDSYRPHYDAWRQTAAARDVTITEPAFAGVFGRTSRDIVQALCGARFTDDQIEAWDREKEALYRSLIATRFPAMDGAADLIAALHAAGIVLAIGSSGPRENVDCVFHGLPGAHRFACSVSGNDVVNGKPAPDIFLKAAALLGVAPRYCAVVEDSWAGLTAARRAGMTAIAITSTTPRARLAEQAHIIVDSLRDLTPESMAQAIRQNAGA